MTEGKTRGVGGTDTNDKQITLGRTWPGGHVLFRAGSRLTEIENRNRNQQKWNRNCEEKKQMQNDVKRKPNRYWNTEKDRRKGAGRKWKKTGQKRRPALLSKKTISVSNVVQCHSRILAALSLSLRPPSPATPTPSNWYVKLCQKQPQVNLFVSVCLCWPG